MVSPITNANTPTACDDREQHLLSLVGVAAEQSGAIAESGPMLISERGRDGDRAGHEQHRDDHSAPLSLFDVVPKELSAT